MGNSMPLPPGQALDKYVHKGSIVKSSFLPSYEDIIAVAPSQSSEVFKGSLLSQEQARQVDPLLKGLTECLP